MCIYTSAEGQDDTHQLKDKPTHNGLDYFLISEDCGSKISKLGTDNERKRFGSG